MMMDRFSARRSFAVVLIALLCQAALLAQKRISLSELGKRNNSDSAPLYAGQKVTIRGVVSLPAFRFPSYTLLAIQDSDRGAVLRLGSAYPSLENFKPGDDIEAEGVV